MKPTHVPKAVARSNRFEHKTLAAYRAAVRRFARRSWVTGVTISIKERAGELDRAAGPVIAIHVRRKRARLAARDRIPPSILGVPTDVIEGDYHLAQAAPALPTPVAFPLRPGSSFGRQVNGSAASIGGVVEDAAGVRYLLCAGHTLREGGKFAKGDPMVHPGPPDGLPAPNQPVVVARYERPYLGADAGLAKLDPQSIAVINLTPGGRRILPPVNASPVNDTVLEKNGRTTGTTRALVQGYGTVAGLYPAMHLRPFPGDPLPVYAEGDSGSVWYDQATGAAVGLHVAVDLGTAEKYAVATLVSYILDQLKVSWV